MDQEGQWLLDDSDEHLNISLDEEDSDVSDIEQPANSEHDSNSEVAGDDIVQDQTKSFGPHYVGRDNVTLWNVHPPRPSRRRRQRNIVIHPLGVKRTAQHAKTVYESWCLFFPDNVLEDIMQFTNDHLRKLRTNYTRESDVVDSNIDEIKALIGLDEIKEKSVEKQEDRSGRKTEIDYVEKKLRTRSRSNDRRDRSQNHDIRSSKRYSHSRSPGRIVNQGSQSPLSKPLKKRSPSPPIKDGKKLNYTSEKAYSRERTHSPSSKNAWKRSHSPHSKDDKKRSCSPYKKDAKKRSQSPLDKESKKRSHSPADIIPKKSSQFRSVKKISPSPSDKGLQKRSHSPSARKKSVSPTNRRSRKLSRSPSRRRKSISPLNKVSKRLSLSPSGRKRSISPSKRGLRKPSRSPSGRKSSISPTNRGLRKPSRSPSKRKRSISPPNRSLRKLSRSPNRRKKSLSPLNRGLRKLSRSPNGRKKSVSPPDKVLRKHSPSPSAKKKSLSPLDRGLKKRSPSPMDRGLKKRSQSRDVKRKSRSPNSKDVKRRVHSPPERDGKKHTSPVDPHRRSSSHHRPKSSHHRHLSRSKDRGRRSRSGDRDRNKRSLKIRGYEKKPSKLSVLMTQDWGAPDIISSLQVLCHHSQSGSLKILRNMHSSYDENSQALHALEQGTALEGPLLFSLLLRKLDTADGVSLFVRGLLDSAAQSTFITEQCAQLLQVKRTRASRSINGISQALVNTKGLTYLNISSLNGNIISREHPILILDKITSDLPRAALSPDIKRKMASFVLADPTFDTPAPIDILLGADLFAQIMTGEQYILGKDLPIAFVLERLGIELRPLVTPPAVTPQDLLQKTLEQQVQLVKSSTGIELPSYYNPSAMNPARYAQQVQKKKLLWGNKVGVWCSVLLRLSYLDTIDSDSDFVYESDSDITSDDDNLPVLRNPVVHNMSDSDENDLDDEDYREIGKEVKPEVTVAEPLPAAGSNTWAGTTFAQDDDGKMTAKFKRLMGIKESGDSEAATSQAGGECSEIIKKQEELFTSMEMQYEVARVATHTHRGVGLGFGTFQYPR
uniref:Small acidic protein-like domain-containing protein n=1 Tax=Timema poppense TaxID=170557 RepID=A0A7R9D2I3_TIMPO|nr:unnamed protein product [Timema poppensis]